MKAVQCLDYSVHFARATSEILVFEYLTRLEN